MVSLGAPTAHQLAIDHDESIAPIGACEESIQPFDNSVLKYRGAAAVLVIDRVGGLVPVRAVDAPFLAAWSVRTIYKIDSNP
jgi:hypothetical protein